MDNYIKKDDGKVYKYTKYGENFYEEHQTNLSKDINPVGWFAIGLGLFGLLVYVGKTFGLI